MQHQTTRCTCLLLVALTLVIERTPLSSACYETVTTVKYCTYRKNGCQYLFVTSGTKLASIYQIVWFNQTSTVPYANPARISKVFEMVKLSVICDNREVITTNHPFYRIRFQNGIILTDQSRNAASIDSFKSFLTSNLNFVKLLSSSHYFD